MTSLTGEHMKQLSGMEAEPCHPCLGSLCCLQVQRGRERHRSTTASSSNRLFIRFGNLLRREEV